MFKYFTNKEEVIQVRVKKPIEHTRIKVELTFVGENQETRIYTEYYSEPSGRDRNIIHYYFIKKLMSGILIELKNNDTILDRDYFKLVSSVIKDVSHFMKEKEVYEQKVITKN
jgi:hypothetical protein